LEPAAGVRRDCDKCRDPDTRVHRIQKVRAIAVEAIRYDVLEWQETLLPQHVEHRRSQLRFTLKGQFPSGAWQKYPYNQTYGIIRAKNG
jgi:hypothetical protein